MSAQTLPELQPLVAQPNAAGDKQRRMTVVHTQSPRPRGIEELCEKFVTVCESAVHPLEIAGALEFDGWNDRAVRKRYGVSDVFALAEEMYRRVPRRPAEPAPQPDAWQISKWRPALHGLLYGLPTVCFTAAAGLLAGPNALTIMIVALLSSWALSQALAYLGYMRLGQGVPVQAQRVLLVGLGAGMAGVLAAMDSMSMLVLVYDQEFIFGVGLGSYMLGATVLLVLGSERLLYLALAPGVLGSTAFLLLGRPPYLEHATWAALAATPLLALGLAVARTSTGAGLRRRFRPAGTKPTKLLSAADVRAALPSAGFGLVAGGLLVFPVAVGTPGHGGVNAGALLASLPLALSMGAAEWMLVWFRRRTQRLLRTTYHLQAFATTGPADAGCRAAAIPGRDGVADCGRGRDRHREPAHSSGMGRSAADCRVHGAGLLDVRLAAAAGLRQPHLPAGRMRCSAGPRDLVARSLGARADHGLHGATHRAHCVRRARTRERRASRLLGGLGRHQRAN